MSTLKEIKKALSENHNVFVAGSREVNYTPEQVDGSGQVVEIFVASQVPTFNAEQLQDFMLSLIPDADALDCVTDAGKTFHFGVLYFTEQVGTEYKETRISMTDSDVKVPETFLFGEHVTKTSVPVLRRISVIVYPSAEIAIKAHKTGKDKHDISIIALSVYQHGLQ